MIHEVNNKVKAFICVFSYVSNHIAQGPRILYRILRIYIRRDQKSSVYKIYFILLKWKNLKWYYHVIEKIWGAWRLKKK